MIPELRIVLDAKNLDGGLAHTWQEAMDLATSAGKRLFTRDEAYILAYHKKKINSILKEHDGDTLDWYYWTSLEYDPTGAWGVNFGSGFFSGIVKSNALTVRAVAAL